MSGSRTNPEKKQRSIRDFFQSNNGSSDETRAGDCDMKNNNSKRPVSQSEQQLKVKRSKLEEEVIVVSDDEDGGVEVLAEVKQVQSVSIVVSENEQQNDIDWQNVEFLDMNDFLEIVSNLKDVENCDTINHDTELDTDFKLNVFKSMLNNVLQDSQFSKLFDDSDWKIIQDFTCLSGPSQRLYVRLFIRKHGWKRKIVYPEIDSDLHPLIKELIASNFVLPSSSLRSLKTSLELLDNSELKVCAKDLKGVKLNGFNRDAMMKAIMMHVKSNRSIESHFYNNRESNSISFNVLKRVLKILNDSAFCINHETSRVFKRMALLSFPPDLNEDEIGVAFGSKLFNLLQLTKGEIKYPYYTVNKVREVFKARQDLINYEESCELESDILTAIEKRDYMKILTDYLPKTKNLYSQFISNEALNADRKLPDYLRIFTAGHILIRCFTHCVGVLEQQKHFEEAVAMYKFLLNQTVYCQDYRGKWYERLTIVYDHHLKKQLKAYNNICKALKDSKVRIGHRYSLYRRGLKLKEILNKFFIELPEYSFNIPDVTIEAPAFCKQVGDRKNLFIQTDEDGSVTFISVEDAVLNHYKESGYPSGLHSEGLVYHSLFGLLFWDIIYYDKKLVADAFRTPYQTIPLDLNSDIFYTRRRELIQQKINKLRSFTADDMCNEMESVWNENKGCLCLVNWEKCDIKQLKEIVHCMKVNTIIEVCEMLAKHFRHTRSGFPDLLIWNADKNLIKAIEVKGPGDQLSPKQSLWINNLNKAGLRTEVCFVKAKKC